MTKASKVTLVKCFGISSQHFLAALPGSTEADALRDQSSEHGLVISRAERDEIGSRARVIISLQSDRPSCVRDSKGSSGSSLKVHEPNLGATTGVHDITLARASSIACPIPLPPIRRGPRRRGHEMVQRSVSLAQPGGGGHRAVHEVERILDGALERPAVGQPSGDRRREGAAGAVGRGRVEPRAGEASYRAVAHEHVDDLVSREMAALHQGGCGAELHERASGTLHVGWVPYVGAHENL